jgi:hypothetical protein
MKVFALSLVCVAFAAANDSSCGGGHPSPVKDCDKVDLGSCGNACCIVESTVPFSTEALYNSTVALLKHGGPDGSFKYVTGPDAAGHNPGDDLRQYKIDWQFAWQATHSTTGGYVDTVDFNVKPAARLSSSIVRASSVSNIHGALGDNGQNYKTLAYAIGALCPTSSCPLKIIHGCGQA